MPNDKLVAGQHGQAGSFSIHVIGQNNEETVYKQRYHLGLASVEERKLSRMEPRDGIPTLEFGETVIVPSVSITNTGMMPTPSQRVEIAIDYDFSDGLHMNLKNRLFLRSKACLMPAETGAASQGFLRYTTIKPNREELGDDYGPQQRLGICRFRAFQLGPETLIGTKLSPMSRYSVEYRAFDAPSGRSFRLAYPVENRSGIIGLRVLGTGEATSIRFSLRNTSSAALGLASESQRALQVQYYLSDDDSSNCVGLEAVKFMKGPVGSSARKRKVLCIDPNRQSEDGQKGHTVKIKNLGPGEERDLVHTLMFSTKAKPFSRASLQVDVLLEDLPRLLPNLETKKAGTFSVVQRRKLVVTCQPTFRNNPSAEVILVTTSVTKATQHQAWMAILEGMLGLKTETYSLTIHGHLDPSKDIKYSFKSGLKVKSLRDVFRGRIVIVLNDKFAPLPHEVRHLKCRPSLLMARSQDYHPSTRFLLVGSDSESIQHLSFLGSSIFTQRSMSADERPEPSPAGTTERTADPTETDASVDTSATERHANTAIDSKPLTSLEQLVDSDQNAVTNTTSASIPAIDVDDGHQEKLEATLVDPSPRQQSLPNGDAPRPYFQLLEVKGVPQSPAAKDSEVSVDMKLPIGKLINGLGCSLSRLDWYSKNSVQHENIKSFKIWLLRALDQERKAGAFPDLLPGLNIASVKRKLFSPPKSSQVESELSKRAESLRRWLRQQDPVRMYVIEISAAPRPVKVKEGVVSVWGLGSLIVHRGISRNGKSLVEITSPEPGPIFQSPSVIQSTSVLYSVATAMDTKLKIRCLCHALRGKGSNIDLTFEGVRQVLRDVLVSDFLMEISCLYDGKLELNEESSEMSTLTLQGLVTDLTLQELMGEAGTTPDLRNILKAELSDLIARLEVSVDCYGASRWWTAISRKKDLTSQRLSQCIDRLKGAWSLFIDDQIIRESSQNVKDSVAQLLKDDPSRSWWDAMYLLHSVASKQLYTSPAPVTVRRHSQIEIQSPEEQATSREHTNATKIQKFVPLKVDAKDVSKLENEFLERQRFGERVRQSLNESRSSFLLP
jgi:hypothetical protein